MMAPEIISTRPFPAAPTVRERPILFSAPMVRALLAGTKTQTRRVIKDQQIGERFSHMAEDGRAHLEWLGTPSCGSGVWDVPEHSAQIASPYGVPGDRLWVREAWRSTGDGGRCNTMPPRDMQPHDVWYEAAGLPPTEECAGKLRPSMFMPRWASRILLEVTDVRVERLNAISDEDARAEGITDGGCLNCGTPEPCGCSAPAPSPSDAYCWLWEQINGPGSWLINPWVWAVSFRRVPPMGGISQTPPGGSTA